MQAQDYAGALWSIGSARARVDGGERRSRAHESAEIVRSWPMRGTLHLVAADDLGWMLGLTGQRMVRAAEGRRRVSGSKPPISSLAEGLLRAEALRRTLRDRAGAARRLDAGGISPAGQRGVHTLGQLAQTGVLVQSATRRLDAARGVGARTRGGSSPRRRCASSPCATCSATAPRPARDFAWWSSLTLTDARAGLAAAGDDLDAASSVDGETYFLRPGLEPAPRAVHLLPGFDEFVLGYTDRTRAAARTSTGLTIVPGGNGVFLPTIVVDGQVVGTWKREKATKKLTTFALVAVRHTQRDQAAVRSRRASRATPSSSASRSLLRLAGGGGRAR